MTIKLDLTKQTIVTVDLGNETVQALLEYMILASLESGKPYSELLALSTEELTDIVYNAFQTSPDISKSNQAMDMTKLILGLFLKLNTLPGAAVGVGGEHGLH